jgi:hypothetical protein
LLKLNWRMSPRIINPTDIGLYPILSRLTCNNPAYYICEYTEGQDKNNEGFRSERNWIQLAVMGECSQEMFPPLLRLLQDVCQTADNGVA